MAIVVSVLTFGFSLPTYRSVLEITIICVECASLVDHISHAGRGARAKKGVKMLAAVI